MEKLEYSEFANIFPLIQGKEFDKLVSDIRRRGLIEPIIVYNGKILDGRNRYRACLDAGVIPRFKEWDGVGSPLAYVISLNLKRRHLSKSQNSMVAARISTLRRGQKRADVEFSTSQEEAGNEVGVSRESVIFAGRVLDSGSQPLIDAVDNDDIAVSLAAKIEPNISALLPEDCPQTREDIIRLGTLYRAEDKVKRDAAKCSAKQAQTKLNGMGDDDVESDLVTQDAEDERTKAECETIHQQLLKKWRTEVGELWGIGDHRLLIGDCTVPANVARLMGGKMARMYMTDPPYNVAYTGKTADALTINNDSMFGNDFYQFLFSAFRAAYDVTEAGCPIYIWHADTERINFENAMTNAGWLHKQTIQWVKNTIVLGRQDYHWQSEPCLYGWKPDAAHQWFGHRNKSQVWFCDKPARSPLHPTSKPVPLLMNAVNNSTREGDLILDSFLGSGSTMEAAHEGGRICYGCELDPKYGAVILERMSALGLECQRIN